MACFDGVVSDCCSKRCYECRLVIACWLMVAVWGCLPRSCLLRGRALSAWVWALLGIGDGWPGVGCFGVAWGWGMADYVQRSSGLLAACGAIDLCRGGSPHREVSEGGFLGNLELSVPQPEGLAIGVAELVYDRCRAPVVSKVEFERPHLVLVRMRSTFFPVPNPHGILSAFSFPRN